MASALLGVGAEDIVGGRSGLGSGLARLLRGPLDSYLASPSIKQREQEVRLSLVF